MASYNTSFSLDKLQDDPDFAALFAKKATDIRKNKADLVDAAKAYDDKYKKEINEGTLKRKLMLEEGTAKGLKGDDIFKDNQLFIPTDDTPILNYLYFLLREEGDHCANITVLQEAKHMGREFGVLKEEFEKKYGMAEHKDHSVSAAVPNMVSYIYGNIGDDTMDTLKKLKTLSMSENEQEAFQAFRKGRSMAEKYKLDWDKIGINR